MSNITNKDEFQRARTDEQRELRRRYILQTTRSLLQKQRLSELSFNEIARQVGLAKSNIMRYFQSREAILLTLLQEEYAEWVDEVETALPAGQETDPLKRVAAVLAHTVMARPLLCELLTYVTTVLEHNVTPTEIVPFKLEIQASMARLLGLLPPYLGQWTEAQNSLFISLLHATISHTWALAHPSEALAEAYANCPDIRRMTRSAEEEAREALITVLAGLQGRQKVFSPVEL